LRRRYTEASAMAIYNLAIHAGRAVSFASGAFLGVEIPDYMHGGAMGPLKGAALLDAAGDATAAAAAATAAGNIASMPDGVIMLPLDQLSDLASLGAYSILYITADTLVLAPSAAMDVLVGLHTAKRVHPWLESAWFQPWILKCGFLVSKCAFKCNSYRYALGDAVLKLGLTWRDIFTAVAAPGLLLAPILLFTVADPGRSFSGSRWGCVQVDP
jgi:hypothetical protein